MPPRTQGVGRGVNWGGFANMADLLMEQGRTVERGASALGSGIGGGLAALGEGLATRRRERAAAEDRNKEREYRAGRDKADDDYRGERLRLDRAQLGLQAGNMLADNKRQDAAAALAREQAKARAEQEKAGVEEDYIKVAMTILQQKGMAARARAEMAQAAPDGAQIAQSAMTEAQSVEAGMSALMGQLMEIQNSKRKALGMPAAPNPLAAPSIGGAPARENGVPASAPAGRSGLGRAVSAEARDRALAVGEQFERAKGVLEMQGITNDALAEADATRVRAANLEAEAAKYPPTSPKGEKALLAARALRREQILWQNVAGRFNAALSARMAEAAKASEEAQAAVDAQQAQAILAGDPAGLAAAGAKPSAVASLKRGEDVAARQATDARMRDERDAAEKAEAAAKADVKEQAAQIVTLLRDEAALAYADADDQEDAGFAWEDLSGYSDEAILAAAAAKVGNNAGGLHVNDRLAKEIRARGLRPPAKAAPAAAPAPAGRERWERGPDGRLRRAEAK